MNSILEQTVRDIELIVLDDGSEDCTWDMLGHYAQKDARVRRVRFDERGGAARCRNVGNRMAQADWVHVADAGDIYHYDTTKVTLQWLKRRAVDVLYCGVGIIDGRGKVIGEERPKKYIPGKKINFSHPSVCYSRKVATERKYREISKETDCYEAFFLELARDGFSFGRMQKTLVMKRELPPGPGMRDLREAFKVKREIYREFNLNWNFPEPA